ncbi:MAG: hypothetical protein JO170_09665 [Verrucomicrobia bacterium]|nr:hypothetical protein [Verrucomicrobiota bacterium]
MPTFIRLALALRLAQWNTEVPSHSLGRTTQPPTDGGWPLPVIESRRPYIYNLLRDPLASETGALADWYGKYMLSTVASKFATLRRKVRGFSSLQPDWDTQGAAPISRKAISRALKLLDLLEKKNVVPNAAIPTSDETILIRYQLGNETFKWEFDGEGQIAFVRIAPDGKRQYVDVVGDLKELPA